MNVSATSGLSTMEITYGDGSTAEQAMPGFTDTDGYLGAGLCDLGFEIVFTHGGPESFLTLEDG
jgi:hypothetical protein